jgi:glycyl-tRNA synthetase beta chain
MAELLIELFMEEIPARMQVRAGEDFKRLVTDKLSAAGIGFTKAEVHSTPRRLALLVDGLPTAQADVREEKKGPRVGSPEQALAGFLKSAGLSSIDQAEQRDTGKGVFYFAVIERKGGATIDALPGIIDAAIRELPWPKSMRWGANEFLWVRPLHSIIALFDGAVIPGALDLGGKSIAYGNQTEGHRFLSPGTLTVTSFADYAAKLGAAHVVLDREERKRLILAGAQAAAKAEGFVLKDDPGLLEEVAGLVEWPVVLTGAIDNQFMDVPAEVLTTSMRTHQRYFALETAEGKLAPRFVVVANRTTIDGGKAVIAGNERVLRARLSDAKFFWDQDLKVKLEDRVPGLKDITFHAKLGSLAQRVERIEALSVAIAKALNWDATVVEQAALAARLSKSDLTTGVVGEFPEVQGIMGRYVAYHEGQTAAVAEAIADHYKPLGPSDRVPTDKVSVAVALAEKIDTLVQFFGIEELPTGSRDPFGLRRAALGVIRLVLENGLRLNIDSVFELAGASRATIGELVFFFHGRLEAALRDKGVRPDVIRAVKDSGGSGPDGRATDFTLLISKVNALSSFLASVDGANLLGAYRRGINLLTKEEGKEDRTVSGAPERRGEPVEIDFYDALDIANSTIPALISNERFEEAMVALAALRGPVDQFANNVMVNAPEADVRENRLRLYAALRALFSEIADFSKIEG